MCCNTKAVLFEMIHYIIHINLIWIKRKTKVFSAWLHLQRYYTCLGVRKFYREWWVKCAIFAIVSEVQKQLNDQPRHVVLLLLSYLYSYNSNTTSPLTHWSVYSQNYHTGAFYILTECTRITTCTGILEKHFSKITFFMVFKIGNILFLIFWF